MKNLSELERSTPGDALAIIRDESEHHAIFAGI